MKDKVDHLFLRSSCFDSGKIRTSIDFDAVVDDKFRGKNGQKLNVYSALSSDAADELLSRFGIQDLRMPIVLTYDNAIISDTSNILIYLRRNNMIK
jgi:hypothetical protein